MHERLLRQIFSICDASRHSQAHREHLFVIFFNQNPLCVGVSTPCASDKAPFLSAGNRKQFVHENPPRYALARGLQDPSADVRSRRGAKGPLINIQIVGGYRTVVDKEIPVKRKPKFGSSAYHLRFMQQVFAPTLFLKFSLKPWGPRGRGS